MIVSFKKCLQRPALYISGHKRQIRKPNQPGDSLIYISCRNASFSFQQHLFTISFTSNSLYQSMACNKIFRLLPSPNQIHLASGCQNAPPNADVHPNSQDEKDVTMRVQLSKATRRRKACDQCHRRRTKCVGYPCAACLGES